MIQNSARIGNTTLWLVVIALAMQVGYAAGDTLSRPEGRVVLTVSGSVVNPNGNGKAEFDMDMLQSLPAVTVETTTPWTEGETSFEGVLVRDVLADAGAEGSTATAVALNDYQFEVPAADFDQYSVILAYSMNGKQLRIRDKGPLWIVYPIDQHEELKNEETHSKMVWQLRELVIE